MMEGTREMAADKVMRILETISLIIVKTGFFFFLFILAISNLCLTTFFSLDYSEIPLYTRDNIFIQLLVVILLIVGIKLFDSKYGIEKVNTNLLLVILLSYVFFVSISWILLSRSTPVADQGIIAYAASEFRLGIFSSLEEGGYLFVYPFQLGIAAVLEFIYVIFGRGNYVAFQLLNVVFACLLFFTIYKITESLFRDKKITNLVLIFMFVCFSPILYTTFVYGTIISFALALMAVWLQIEFYERKKITYFILSGFFISLAIIIKSNSQIVLIAMIIFHIMEGMKRKKVQLLLLPIILVGCAFISQWGLNSLYETRSGIKLSEGSPKLLWVAMGIQESEYGNGWYNGYPYDIYVKSDYNSDKASCYASNTIRKRINAFLEDPVYMVKFFGEKFVSEWCDPTFEGFWISRTNEGERSSIAESFYTGKLHQVSLAIMNIYQSFISLLALVYISVGWKTIKWKQTFLAVIVLGGFAFHMLWEAKGQYTMVYFVILLPYAAKGGCEILSKLSHFKKA